MCEVSKFYPKGQRREYERWGVSLAASQKMGWDSEANLPGDLSSEGHRKLARILDNLFQNCTGRITYAEDTIYPKLWLAHSVISCLNYFPNSVFLF